jgi:hypothetical protein
MLQPDAFHGNNRHHPNVSVLKEDLLGFGFCDWLSLIEKNGKYSVVDEFLNLKSIQCGFGRFFLNLND